MPLLMEVLCGSRGAESGQQQPSHASSAKSLSLSSVSSWPLRFALYVLGVGGLVKNIFWGKSGVSFLLLVGEGGMTKNCTRIKPSLAAHLHWQLCVCVHFNCYCQLISLSVTHLQWISYVKGEPKLRSMMVPVSQNRI